MSTGHPEVADTTDRVARRKRMQRVQLMMGIFAAFTGLSSLARVAGKERFQTYHTMDVIGLVTAGAGFGVALVVVIQFFALRNKDLGG